MLNAVKHRARANWESTQAARARCFTAFSMTFFLMLLTLANAYAQAPNDNIESRRLLQVEETATSHTAGCTVQLACLNQRLTSQYIDYNNDQWFEFRPASSGTYYVNIGGQHCRKQQGVQLVVLTGTPCQPATYQLVSCTSFSTQYDLYVALPGLQAGQAYLLDVDGYLKDACGFTLQVSRRARGLPVGPAGITPVLTQATSPYAVVRLTWHVPDSLAATSYCRVLRREQYETQAYEVGNVPIEHDSTGRRYNEYAIIDSLPGSGYYYYHVVTEVADQHPAPVPPVIVRRVQLAYDAGGNMNVNSQFLTLPLDRYPATAYLSVAVHDAETGQLLRKLPIDRRNAPASQSLLYSSGWRLAGVKRVAVDITHYPPGGPPTTDHLLLPLSGGRL